MFKLLCKNTFSHTHRPVDFRYVSKRFFPKKIHIKRLQALLKSEDDGLIKKRPDQREAVSLVHALRFALLLNRRVFDETVQIHLNMNLDARKGDQLIRANIYLPHGTGKTTRVLVFCSDAKAQEARDNGADTIADDTTMAEIKKGQFNFDRVIATPDQMRRLKEVARILGPAGLMPNPKMGTLTMNIGQAIRESKAGQVPVRLTKDGQLEGPVGKVSMGEQKLHENITSFIHQIRDQYRPKGAREVYFLGSVISTSSGRGFRALVDENEPWTMDIKKATVADASDQALQGQINYFKEKTAAA